MGSELALGHCEEPVAGLGGLGRGAAVPRTSWELENPSTPLLSVPLKSCAWQLSS